MSIVESQDLDTVLSFTNLQQRASNFSGAILHALSESISSTSCSEVDSDGCRDDFAAFNLKIIAIVAILFASIFGVALPLVGKKRRFLRTDGNLFAVAKAFAAGVILATGFVHMLPDADDALTDPCLPTNPWSKFPFSGFIAMLASLGTLIIDFVGTQYYEQKHEKERAAAAGIIGSDGVESGLISIQVDGEEKEIKGSEFTEEEGSGMHIVGMHAHAAAHRHSHAQGGGFCDGQGPSRQMHGHSHGHGAEDESISSHVRHVVVSQVLELGIVSHSVLIGLSVGVSHSPCTIRPLIAALSFHQFFEGFALGGCISQAQFKTLSTTLMACFFAITTPLGIGIGTVIASFYNPNSPRALVVEGIFDSISAGILVYMALVDLIAADFLSKRIRCNTGLQIGSYFALFLGASLMSLLAIWA